MCAVWCELVSELDTYTCNGFAICSLVCIYHIDVDIYSLTA